MLEEGWLLEKVYKSVADLQQRKGVDLSITSLFISKTLIYVKSYILTK